MAALPMPELVLRPMHEDDVPEVIRLEQACYTFPWTEGIFRDCVRVGYLCCVSELGPIITGYGVITAAAGEAHLLNVCVREEFRCRGVGRQLMRWLFVTAYAHGAHTVFLEARPSNTTALRLYQSLGFRQIGMRRGYYQAVGGREDALVFTRPLHADGS